MNWEAHESREQTAGFVAAMEVARMRGSSCVWSIREHGEFAGVVGLHGIERVVRAWRVERAELGYWIGAPFRRRGLVTEAARAVIAFGFDRLGLHKICVGHIADNEASRGVITALGFRLVGVERDHLHRHGRWWDHVSWEMTVDEWRARS
jgi:RimJ/RimL family protein N-acetyltransferase